MAESETRDFLVTDYFDDIKPSLLSSDDIHRYAKEGWLVTDYDENRCLPAGYKFRFLGQLIHWKPAIDDSLELVEEEVTEGKLVTLPGNSITYLHMYDEFRLPQYIAARFNLRITQVHQGLLLGTGPMVDPGFHGRLLVPLHNLTGNDYVFTGGDNFIHVEFTKLSPLRRWNKKTDPEADHDDHYKIFDKGKITERASYYFKKAGVQDKGGVVSNLTPLTTKVDSALADIQSISEEVKESQRSFNIIGISGIVALLVLIFTAVSLIIQAQAIKDEVHDVAVEAEAKLVEARSILSNALIKSGDPGARLVGSQQGVEIGSDVSESSTGIVELHDELLQEDALEDESAPPEKDEDDADSEGADAGET